MENPAIALRGNSAVPINRGFLACVASARVYDIEQMSDEQREKGGQVQSRHVSPA
jgi:hypothetical protein